MGQTASILVCGLGPGGINAVTEATREALSSGHPIYLRTERHPSASLATSSASYVGSFDEIYERAESFADVYVEISDRIMEAARRAAEEGPVVYAVPGSPLVLERSVQDLRRRAAAEGLTVRVLPALSFLDEAWTRLGVDPVDDGVRLIDGHRFVVEAADQRGPLLVAHAHAPWVLSDIKLAIDAGTEQKVIVLQRLGTEAEHVTEVAWPDLDRLVEPDHLTSLYLPELVAPAGRELARSVEMMSRLRADCPWDRRQDHRSLRRYLIEEAYEVVEAIDRLTDAQAAHDEPAEGWAYAELEEELGDLLFQVLFHAELATEAGQFTLADVARTLTDKMIHRHPHVYGEADGADEHSWEQLKAEEKERTSAMDDLPNALPALALADKMLKRAERAGHRPDLGKADELIERLLPANARPNEAATVALAVVARSRDLGIPLEQALHDLLRVATQRYRAQEADGTIAAGWVGG